MKRRSWPALLLALALCGCAPRAAEETPVPTPSPVSTPTPTPSPTPDAWGFPKINPNSASVHTLQMGEEGFWVEAVSQGLWENEFARDLTLSIYRREGDTEPLQVIETTVGVWPDSFQLCAEDVNFDGYPDLYYLYSEGTHNRYYSYYVWDEESQRFIEDPCGLSGLENPTFDQEHRAVVTWYRTSIWGGSFSYYRYVDGELVCVRVCSYPYEHDPESAALRVKDLVDGQLQTVFEVERASDEEFTDEEREEFNRWHDLDYHGSHTLELDVGDGRHTLWIEITPRESEEEGIPITVSVYDSREKTALLQRWEDVCYLYDFQDIGIESRDLDFDGDMDLEYSSWLSARMAGRAYWVWDGKAERFVRDPYGLEDLPWPEFDLEKQVVTTWYNGSGGTGDAYYRYLDGKLTCVRSLSRDVETSGEWCVVGVVKDYINGQLTEVYREEFTAQGEAWPHSEEFDRWYDLDYHG